MGPHLDETPPCREVIVGWTPTLVRRAFVPMNEPAGFKLTTPVVFVIFNRPDCTRRSFAALRAARPTRLYVVADGPRRNREGEAAVCAEVRAIVEQGVDWPCEVINDYAAANLGCARRVSSGLDAVFARESEAIILEDDCVPDPSFFRFCAELLERYRDEPKIGQISGCTFQDRGQEAPASYYFSRYPHCWGWATWRRAWRHYDHAMTWWQESPGQAKLREWVPDPAERRVWADRLDATLRGQLDSWAYRWILVLWQRGCLSISPYRNLVLNIGFGDDATHTGKQDARIAAAARSIPFPLAHPASMAPDDEADEHTSRRVYRPPSLVVRIQRRVRRIFT